MIRSVAVRVSLVLIALSCVSGRSAELLTDDEPGRELVGKVRNPGTRLPTPEIAPASDEAVQALSRMRVPDGLEIKLWAAEPMLANPVAFNFDEKGRIFVAETYRYRTSVLDIRDYMWMLEDDLAARTLEDRTAMTRRRLGEDGLKELSIETEVLRLLEDTDGDGVADRSSVYADGFNSHLDGIASGVLARRGEVFFTNIPSLWKFTGAQRAETRTELSRGYGIRFNYTGHDFHGLVFGPDGKIYFSNGDRGTHVKTQEGGIVSVPDTGAVFRCNPDGSELEVFAWGLRNPQSLLFTENGDLLTGDNDSDQGDEERLVHVVEGSDSGWRIGYQFAPLGKAGPWNSEKLWHQRHAGQPAYLTPPISNVEDGPSGITYYPGTGLNPSYHGSIFLTHFKGAIARSGIYTYNLKQNGASYEIADSKPFLTAALPTDARFGPDGRLYFSDWAEGWPKSKRGRIYAISDPKQQGNALIKETQRLIGSDWAKKSPEQLAQLLSHADWRVRLEAQFTLAERGAAAIPLFAQAAAVAGQVSDLPSSAAYARRHAIWGLGQIADKDPAALIPVRTLVNDADFEVRAQAIKVLGEHPSADAADLLLAALADGNARVRFFAGQSLGKLARVQPELSGRITGALIEALRANDDRDAFLRHGLVMGLAGAKHVETLAAAVTDRSKAVRLGAVLALRRIAHPDAQKFLNDSDAYIAREAALAINDEPINAALPGLAATLARNSSDTPFVLRAINAHFRLGQPENAQALAEYAARADAPAHLRAEALAQLALWPNPPARDRIVGVYRPIGDATAASPAQRDRQIAAAALLPMLDGLLAPSTPSLVQTAALLAQQSLEIAGASDTLFRVVRDAQQPGASRAAALGALEKIKDPRLLEAVQIASTSSSAELRLAALPIAARLSPEASAPVLANLVAHGDSEERKAAFRALGRHRHSSADTLLAEQLRLLEAGKVDPAAQIELLNAAGRREDANVKKLLAERETKLAASPDPLAPYRVALEGGDAQRGRRIFETQPVLACIRCHRGTGDGGDAGPDLGDIGAKQDREYLLEAIVKPNAKIAPGFDTIVLTLKSGGVAAGIVASETDDTLTLRNADNKLVAVKKSNIAKREGAPSSMPEIYGAILTKTELRDVVEYLVSLKEKAPAIGADQPRALRGFPSASR